MAETVEQIHNRMLDNTADSFDKSNGSFIFDAERAGAIEMQLQQLRIDNALARMNITNLTGADLELAVRERTAITRREATKATTTVKITGTVGAKITKGAIVSTGEIDFVSLEEKAIPQGGSMTVQVEAVQAGSISNVGAQTIDMFPTTISGLVSVTNDQAVTNGYDAESDSELLTRYFDRLQNAGKSGNAAHYREWALEIAGVGDAKVFPTYDGPLTVQVVIIGQNAQPATPELVKQVKDHISAEMPFGVKTLDVVSATTTPINLSMTLTLQQGADEATVKESIKANITNKYFKEIAFKSNEVSYAKIGAMIIDTVGVLDYQNLKVNNGTANIKITDKNIPIMGVIS